MQPTGKYLCCQRNQQLARQAIPPPRFRADRFSAGYSLIEVVIAAGIVAVVYGLILNCYIQSGLRAQWSGYSLAAQSLAIQQIEQARAAAWDPATGNNQITNLTLFGRSYNSSSQTWSGYATNILDVPYSSTNVVRATNYVTIQLINCNNTNNPLVQLYMISVDTVWPFYYRSFNKGSGTYYFSNVVSTYLAPDNRDPGTL